MTTPAKLNVAGMEERIARCALGLIPSVANAIWRRSGEAERNALGDIQGDAPVDLAWSVPVYVAEYIAAEGKPEAGGDLAMGRQVLLVGPPPEEPTDPPGAFDPQKNDYVVVLGETYRIERVQHQPVAEAEYWRVEAVRLA